MWIGLENGDVKEPHCRQRELGLREWWGRGLRVPNGTTVSRNTIPRHDFFLVDFAYKVKLSNHHHAIDGAILAARFNVAHRVLAPFQLFLRSPGPQQREKHSLACAHLSVHLSPDRKAPSTDEKGSSDKVIRSPLLP